MTILLPEMGERMDALLEHRSPLEKGLVIEVAAIHEGMTANFNNYPATELAAALPSWTSPYPKPVLLHHDPLSEPVGRIIGARMDKEDDGTPYVRLQVAVTDPEAMKKVRDQRYLTGSVGGKAGKASCTVCNADWSKASMFELPCKHQRGKTYQGKLASIEMADITFKEYSFVNMPADQRSGVRAVHQPLEGEESDFRPARFFSLDMHSEAITEFGESERNVLGALRPQEASALYLGLKGAFLSALAEDTKEKNGMGTDQQQDLTPPIEEEEEDVLAVAEGLSEDLSQPTPEEEGEEEGSEEEESEETDEPAAEDESGEEGDEADVKPHPYLDKNGDKKCDICGATKEQHNSADTAGKSTDKGTPKDSEEPADEGAEEETPEEEGAEEEIPPAAEEESETTDEGTGDSEPEPEAEESDLEKQVAELQAQVENLNAEALKLTEENGRLKTALKRGLAERVVDMKIALGLHESEEREAQLTEHLTRAASSLADTLRDLSAMPRQQPSYQELPKIKPTVNGVGGDEREPVVEVVSNSKSPKPTDPEEIFVDALMGRRPL
jgi:hypothetical protein